MLKIAIQKSGRLYEDSIKILRDAGISIDHSFGQLRTFASNFDLEVFFLRNSDIPQYLRDGVVDIAIIGDNLLIEKGTDIDTLEHLGFSKCRVSIGVPKIFNYKSVNDLNNKKIATSYPNTVRNFFSKKNIDIDIHQISGSVEIAPNIGLADAIVDIVSSGSTLLKNNLKEVETILKSEAVLAVSKKISTENKLLLEKLQFRLNAVLNARKSKYILLNAPNENLDKIIDILPVMRSPTVVPLAQKNWSSIHSVINEDKFWEIIYELKKAGAEGILVSPIEKIIL